MFEKGALFYMEYNIRLFFFLLFSKTDLLVSNDLDTLLPNYLISKIKNIPLVYDTHEYFTGVPELQDRAMVRKIWKSIESYIFPKLKYVFTVNDSIALLYWNEYRVKPHVVRNVPLFRKEQNGKTREELGIPLDKKMIVLQGAGINVRRGGEEAVLAMSRKFGMEDYILYIIGSGDVIDVLKRMSQHPDIVGNVVFIDRLPYHQLMEYTCLADLGLTLDKGDSINYQFSLPNKIFDYISAGIPVLASPLPEIKKIIHLYKIGETIANHEPEHIASMIKQMCADNVNYPKENFSFAASQLCWENEEKEILKVYQQLV